MSGPTTPRKTVRVAIAGVGNCASSLVQGVEFYRDADPTERVPGLMHVELGGYHVGDVEFVAAFDVDADKVGLDLGKAIFASINNTIKFADVPELGVLVQRGPTFDGLGKFYREVVEESPGRAGRRRPGAARRAAPTCSCRTSRSAPRTRRATTRRPRSTPASAFVNAIPVFIASNPEWAQKFTDAGVPIVGDDIKSQVGATITHRLLARLFEDRGLAIDNTYQLNFGGNMDFKNMLERERLLSKKMSKTQSVTSQIDQGISSDERAHRPVGPRAVAQRPQVGVHPPRGPQLRRRAAQRRAEARGVGLAELGRRDHRRGALRQARPRPRHRRPAARPVGVLHEVAAGAVPRRRGAPDGRGVRRRVARTR